MKAIIVVAAALLLGALRPDPAYAWASANRWGGSTSHSWGSTSHTNAWGGSSSHAYGEGTEHTNAYGGSSAHAWGAARNTPTLTAAAPMGHMGRGQRTPIPRGRLPITRQATVDIPRITRLATVGITGITRRSWCHIIRARGVTAAPRPQVRWSVRQWARRQRPPIRQRRTLPGMPLAPRRDIGWA